MEALAVRGSGGGGRRPKIRARPAGRPEDQGHVESEWGLSENNRRAKYYQLTASGRRQLRAESTVWKSYAAAVLTVLEAT